jgi:hypothetical protein
VSQCGDAAIVSLPLNVIPKLLFETRSRRIEWGDPVGLFGLRFGDHVETSRQKIHPEQRSRMTKEKNNGCDKQLSLAHFDLEKSLVWGQKPQVYMTYDSIV